MLVSQRWERKCDVPCTVFGRQGLRSFLITSPRPDRYKKWRSQIMADTVITALPRTGEVVVIAYVTYQSSNPVQLIYDLVSHSIAYQQDPRQAVSLVNKWGPSTRRVISILRYPHEEKIRDITRSRQPSIYTTNHGRHATLDTNRVVKVLPCYS